MERDIFKLVRTRPNLSEPVWTRPNPSEPIQNFSRCAGPTCGLTPANLRAEARSEPSARSRHTFSPMRGKNANRDGFGRVQTGSDEFRRIRMSSDGFGRVRTGSEGFGWVQTSSNRLEQVETGLNQSELVWMYLDGFQPVWTCFKLWTGSREQQKSHPMENSIWS